MSRQRLAGTTGGHPAGFTLTELLVVVGIIGILAAIALPFYSGHKQSASDRNMEAALRAARNAIEAYYESNGSSYEGATVAALEGKGMRTGDATLVIEEATPSSYTLRACYPGGSATSFVYDSDVGTNAASATGCS